MPTPVKDTSRQINARQTWRRILLPHISRRPSTRCSQHQLKEYLSCCIFRLMGGGSGGERARDAIASSLKSQPFFFFHPHPYSKDTIFPFMLLKASARKFDDCFYKVANLVLCFSSLPPDNISLRLQLLPNLGSSSLYGTLKIKLKRKMNQKLSTHISQHLFSLIMPKLWEEHNLLLQKMAQQRIPAYEKLNTA